MSDTAKAWIEEWHKRQAGPHESIVALDIAMTDAYNMFPRALNALEQVLGLHVCLRNSASALYPTPLCTCGQNYPCLTVQAIEGAINE